MKRETTLLIAWVGLLPGFLGLIYLQSIADEGYSRCLEYESKAGGVSYCVQSNIAKIQQEGHSCIREGYTGKKFFGLSTDFDTAYYVCEGYGRVAYHCIEYGISNNYSSKCVHKNIWGGLE